MRFIALVLFSVVLTIKINAQSPWMNAIPTIYHPSFAGGTSQLRIVAHTITDYNRDEFNGNGLGYVFNYNYLSADNFFSKLHSGIAVNLLYCYEPDKNTFKNKFLQGSFAVAPKFSFKNRITLSPSVQLTYGDYYKPYAVYNTSQHDSIVRLNPPQKLYDFTMKAGLMVNSRKYFAGLTIYFCERTNTSYKWTHFYSVVDFMTKLSFTAGYTFSRGPKSDFSFTPVLLLGGIPDWNLMVKEQYYTNFYLNFKYKKFLAGIDFFTNIMLGYDAGMFRLMVIQRIGAEFTDIIDNDTYSIQLSLRCLIGKKSKTKLY